MNHDVLGGQTISAYIRDSAPPPRRTPERGGVAGAGKLPLATMALMKLACLAITNSPGFYFNLQPPKSLSRRLSAKGPSEHGGRWRLCRVEFEIEPFIGTSGESQAMLFRQKSQVILCFYEFLQAFSIFFASLILNGIPYGVCVP